MHGDSIGGPIRWRMHIPVSPEVVFRALNTDTGRASFWAESAVEQEGAIEFRFANGYSIACPVLAREAPTLFKIAYFGGAVQFELTPDGHGGTDLYLVHTGVGEAEWQEVHAGWLNVLFPLKAWLTHGIDLRNHDPTRTWTQGYADQ